jgi:ADP-heptose:LPS heptosyltransferase
MMTNQLNSVEFDLVISTHSGRLPSDILSKIKTKHRINNHYRGRNKFYDILTDESSHFRSAIERDLDCMRSLGLEPNDTKTEIFLTPEETEWAKNKLRGMGFDLLKKIALVHPTAGGTVKEWPIERFGELLIKLNNKDHIQPLVLCTDKEYIRVQHLFKYAPDLIILHQLTLRQMIAIINECDLVIDNDSSPSHVATAFDIPTIVLFGQGIREMFRPYHPENDLHYVFYKDVDCRDCALVRCDNRICLEFSPNEVFEKALEMISDTPKYST